jgi:hypothetical protein
MRTIRAIRASRLNGKRSRGPVTPEGKLRVSQNAIRHGLLSQQVVLPSESQEAFDALLEQHTAKLVPIDDVEQTAVDDMTAATWRLQRIRAIETRLLKNAVDKRPEADELDRLTAAFSALAAGPDLNLLDRYESRLHNIYRRSLYNLILLRHMEMPQGQMHELEVSALEIPEDEVPCLTIEAQIPEALIPNDAGVPKLESPGDPNTRNTVLPNKPG